MTNNRRAAALEALDAGVSGLGRNLFLTPLPVEVREVINNAMANLRVDAERDEFERIVATLTFDSADAGELVGSRSVGTATSRQLVWSAGDVEILLSVWDDAQGITIEGQVLSANDQQVTVRLVSGSESFSRTESDDLGEFRFERVAPGSYSILVALGFRETVLGPLDL